MDTKQVLHSNHLASYPIGTGGGLFLPGREADHSHPYSTEVKNVCVELYLHSPNTSS
jgi:hypothetical protein